MIGANRPAGGSAGTADVIAFTVLGTEDGVPKILDQGTLTDSAADFFTPNPNAAYTVIESITLVNTSGSTVSDIQIYLYSADYPITGKFSLGAYGWAVITPDGATTIYTATGATPTVGMLAEDGSVTGATSSQQVFTNGIVSNGNIEIASTKNIKTTGSGSSFGATVSEKTSLHGVTPVIQRAGAAQAAVVTTAATNSSPYGYAQAQADAIVTLVNELRAALVEKGIIKGAA